jgi:prostaglandin-endoperoxide synthase 2
MQRKDPHMGSSLQDFAIEALELFAGHDDANKFLINRLVTRARNRPHPWTTKHDYISWTGLTDRTYNARLLRAKPYPPAEAFGTRRPPLADVVKLFQAAPTGQRICPKSTLLFPAFAQYLTDGFLRTQMANDPPFGSGQEDRRRTTSNHEIDQSPLYGRTQAQTMVLRDMSGAAGKKGQLKSQIINGEEYSPFLFGADGKVKPEFCDASGTPILDQPLGLNSLPPGAPHFATLFAAGGDRANATPQVSMMNILFLREHNRLAKMLEADNPGWDNNRVFETARNIIIVMFIKIVVEEYINHINTSNFRFRADPEVAWKANWNRPNWMTSEFSLLYRWHSLVPETLKWGGTIFSGAQLLLNNAPLIASGLAVSFAEVSANHATALGLGNSASFLIRAEEKAVAQARTNNIASYNDYREAMDMDRADSFEDIVGKSSNAAEKARRKALADELKRLYGTPDNVEFYVGLFAEPLDENGPLPDLILAMVAMDAFSQALTNPLLSKHVWGDKNNRELAFTKKGIKAIEDTKTVKDVLLRNASGLGSRFVGMTRADWRRD